MNSARAAVFYFIIAVTVIFVAGLCFLLSPVASPEVRYSRLIQPWCRFAVRLLKVVCGVSWKVEGLENIPAVTDRVVVMSKHQSAWETLFLPAVLPQRTGFVYKESLHRIPFFGWALKSMDMIPINRSQGRSAFASFLAKGKRHLDKGWWITIFPEGTRTEPGVRSVYKTGGARFACAMKADILPVALNSGRCWGRNSMAKTPGVITVSFGPVIKTAGMEHAAVHEAVQNWIEDEVERIDAAR